MLRKIKAKELQAGMYLHELCGSWMQHPFWRQQFLLEDTADIKRLLASGITEVIIDTSRGLDLPAEAVPCPAAEPLLPAESPAIMQAQPFTPSSLGDEIERAVKIREQAKTAVTAMFQEARLGKAIDSKECESLVADISASVLRNPNAFVSLVRLKSADEYTYMHSVAVCALMVSLARQLGFAEAQIREAGMAGLLHDLGKARMPLHILNKPGRLTDNEFAVIQNHPKEGHRILSRTDSVGSVALDVCLHHHEKMDGSGYPEGLKGDAISLYARMGAVCDVYDAITSNRPYKLGWSPGESIWKMASWCDGHFDREVFRAFVRSVGIYPIGSLVKLKSGKLAVVIEQNDRSFVTPIVKAFYHTRTREPLPPETLDLSSDSADDAIAHAEDPDVWKLDRAYVDALWSGVTVGP